MLRLSVILFFLFSFSFSYSPKDYQKKLGVGINVNWVLFKKIEKRFCLSDIDSFKKRGFNSVRIRFDDNVDLKRLDKIINRCLKDGLIPVLSYSGRNFRLNPQKYENQAVHIWEIIAKRYKNEPYELSYDLLIEPNKKIKKHNNILNGFYKRAVKNIRRIDKKRILFLAPNHISNPYWLNKLYIPKNDRYIMIEWHFYAAGPKRALDDAMKRDILNKIKYAKNWCESHGLYSWVGAWMPGNYNHGNTVEIMEQIKFAEFLSCALRKNSIPYAVNAGAKFYDYKTHMWIKKYQKVLNAFLFPECK